MIKTNEQIGKLANQAGRDYWFDNAKALLIISVVVGHLATGTLSTATVWLTSLQKFIYIYHMPVFMMISGRFAKRRIDQKDYGKMVTSLLIPYLVLQVLMSVWICATGWMSISSFSFFKPYFGLWYLITLFAYMCLTPHLKKFRFLFPISIVVALAAGLSLYKLWGGFHRLFTYYPFFLFGYYTAGRKFSVFQKWWFRLLSAVVFFGTAVYFIMYGRTISFRLLELNTSFWTIKETLGVRLRVVLGQAVLRYLAAFLSFGVIMGITPRRKMFYSYVGTHSVYVYVLHLFLCAVLRGLEVQFQSMAFLNTDARLIMYLCAGVVCSFLLASKPVRKVCGFLLEPNISLEKWRDLLLNKKEGNSKSG